MAAGRPIVLAIDGVIREVVEAAKGGIFVPPGDDKALAQAVFYLSTHLKESHRMGMQARAYVEAHFERQGQARALETLLKCLLRR